MKTTMQQQSIQLIFHGAGQGIGKSCIEAVFADETRVLLDCGMKTVGDNQLNSVEDIFPITIENLSEIAAVIITHSHVDHCGALPYLVKHGLRCPVISSSVTASVMELMLRDSLKLSRRYGLSVFDEDDIKKAMSLVNVGQSNGRINEVAFRTFSSGHIPGSWVVLLEFGGRSFLYTSDLNDEDTRLTFGCRIEELPQTDCLILDATYADVTHPSRERNIQRFQKMILETTQQGGSVIIPAFAIAKTQEVILLTGEIELSCRRFIDGLGVIVTERFLDNLESLRDSQALQEAFLFSAKVNSFSRKHAGNAEQGVYITTSGMLNGGAAFHYLRQKGGDKKNLILICGYQAAGSGGRQLLETGRIVLRDEKGEVIEVVEPKCRVEQVGLSSHIDADGIERLMQAVQPKIVIAQHGNQKACQAVVDMAQEMGIQAFAPATGDRLTI